MVAHFCIFILELNVTANKYIVPFIYTTMTNADKRTNISIFE